MNGRLSASIVLLAALAAPADAFAQGADQPFRKWDAGGGFGTRFANDDDAVIPTFTWSAEVGRYWTAHLKTAFGIATIQRDTWTGFSFNQTTRRQTKTTTRAPGLSGTVAYQFLDNVFVHPYVLAGVRLASVSESIETRSSTTGQILSITTSPFRLLGRPIAGGGFKSYFENGRAFMRSEFLVAPDDRGAAHVIFYIGAGADF